MTTVADVEPANKSVLFEEVNLGAEIHSKTEPPSDAKQSEDFNPEIHCKNADGSPRRNRDGSFRRKPIQKGAQHVEAEVEENNFTSSAPPACIEMVSMVLTIGTLLSVKSFGEEWRLTNEENQALTDVWARFCHYKGWDMQATPELVVMSTTLAVFLPRIMNAKFLERFKRKPVNAHTGNRENENGQNVTGENNSSTGVNGGAGDNRSRPSFE